MPFRKKDIGDEIVADTRQRVLADPVAAALPVLAPERGVGTTLTRKGESGQYGRLVRNPAMRGMVCQYRALGLSALDIAHRLGLGKTTVARFVKSPEYFAEFELRRAELQARIDENARTLIQEVAVEAIQRKVRIMRSTRNAFLENKVCDELIALWKETLTTPGKTGVSDRIRAVWERAISRTMKDGTTTTEKVRISAPAGATIDTTGLPADLAPGGSADATGDSGGSRADAAPGAAGGAERAAEVASGA